MRGVMRGSTVCECLDSVDCGMIETRGIEFWFIAELGWEECFWIEECN